MTGPLSKHEVAQVAVTSQVAAENDGLGVQIRTWLSKVSYAARVNVSRRLTECKRAPDELEKIPTKLVDDRYQVGLIWAEKKASIQNNEIPHTRNSVHWSEGCKWMSLSSNLKQRYEETINVDLQKVSLFKLDKKEL